MQNMNKSSGVISKSMAYGIFTDTSPLKMI